MRAGAQVPEALKRIPDEFSTLRAVELPLPRVPGQFDLPSRPESARAAPSPTSSKKVGTSCLDRHKLFLLKTSAVICATFQGCFVGFLFVEFQGYRVAGINAGFHLSE